MPMHYTIAHAAATLLGAVAFGVQARYLWTMNGGLTLETGSMLVASAGAALLPVLAERFWHVSRRHALALAVPGLCLLAWVVPTVAGKMRSGAEQAILTAETHNARLEAAQVALAGAQAAFHKARQAQEAECQSGAGTRCKGTQATLENARRDLKAAEEAAKGTPMPMPLLPAEHAALLPIGLELTIWACWMVGLGPLLCIERDLRKEPLSNEELEELRELHEPDEEEEGEPPGRLPEPLQKRPVNRSVAEKDLIWLLATGTTIPSQEWLRRRWGIEAKHKGTITKWVQHWEARGFCRRQMVGRQMMIVGVEPKVAA